MHVSASRSGRGFSRCTIALVLELSAITGCGVGKDQTALGPQMSQDLTSDFVPYPWPSTQSYVVTQGNGGLYKNGSTCVSGGDHTGLAQYAWDWGLPGWTPVLATKGGTVKMTQFLGSGDACWNGVGAAMQCGCWTPTPGCTNNVNCIDRGNYVVIDHGDGTQALYLHLWEVDVSPKQIVTAGQQIGKSGNSGCSTGPHLHYMVSNAGASYYSQSIPSSFNGHVPVCAETDTSSNSPASSCSAYDSQCGPNSYQQSCTGGACAFQGCCCPTSQECVSGSFFFCCPSGQICATGGTCITPPPPSPHCDSHCNGGGWWCGGQAGMTNTSSNHVYHFPGGNTNADRDESCPGACHISPPGVSDYCNYNRFCGGGSWCGNDCVNGGANTLYYIYSNNTLGSATHCMNGCATAAAGHPDYCR